MTAIGRIEYIITTKALKQWQRSHA